nr:MAG TPA: major capsid protein [Caudoviricetes sp.]
MSLEIKRDEAQKIINEMRALNDRAQNEKRDFTADEQAKYNALDARFDSLQAEIKRAEKLAEREKFMDESPSYAGTSQGEREAMSERELNSAFFRMLAKSPGEQHQLARALNITTDADGGFTVPKSFASSVIEKLNKETLMRKISSVIATSSTTQIPVEAARPEFKWLAEAAAFSEVSATFSKIELNAHKCGGVIKLSTEILEDSSIDIENYIRNKMYDALSDLEEQAFLNGTGTNQPTGACNGLTASVTTATQTTIKYEEVLDLYYALAKSYRANACFIVSDSFEKQLRLIKDGNGMPIWQPALSAGAPNTLLGRPIYTSEFLPTVAKDAMPAIFGDFSYYQIADRGGISLQRLNELYAINGQIGLLIQKRVDAKLTLADAVKALKMKNA